MTEPERKDGIEVEENIVHERRTWIFERVGWITIAVLILLTLLGLFGKGALSHAKTATADGTFEVEYERFAHFEGPTTLRVRVQPEGLSEPETRIWVSQDFLKSVRIEQIEPEPESQHFSGDGVLYAFPATPGDQSTEVNFYLVTDKIGKRTAKVGPSEDKSLRFWQFVYP